jgi:hypothetical protein
MSKETEAAKEFIIKKLCKFPNGVESKRIYNAKQFYFSRFLEQGLRELVHENRARCINGRWYLV